MKHALSARAGTLAILSLVAWPLAAEVADQGRDQLAAYVEAALESNRACLMSSLDVEDAKARSLEARSALLPRVSVSARATLLGGDYNNLVGESLASTLNGENEALNALFAAIFAKLKTTAPATLPEDSVYVGPQTDVLIGASFQMALFNAPALETWKASEAAVLAGEAEREAGRNELVYKVKSSYYDWLEAGEALATVELLRATAEEHLRTSRALVEAGKETEDAVYAAVASQAQLYMRRAQAEAALSLSAARLNQLIGRALDSPLETGAEPQLPGAASLPGLEECVAAALASRPELARLAAAGEAIDHKVRAARGARLPTVGLAADAGLRGEGIAFDDDHLYLDLSLVGKVDFYSGGQSEASLRQAQIAAARLGLQREEAAAQVALDVRSAWSGLEVALATAGAAARVLEASEASFDLVRRRYAAGMAGDMAYRQSEAELAQARLAELDARHECLRAVAGLERAMGVPLGPRKSQSLKDNTK